MIMGYEKRKLKVEFKLFDMQKHWVTMAGGCRP